MASDPFESLLNLEDQFYQSGYAQGEADGYKAGLIEGRSLGLEKGFQKFVESSRLHGKAIVWANRLPNLRANQEKQELSPLPSNARLEKNVTMLFGLTEPETLSTENTDEAVNDFDDRLKRAQGKAKIIEKAVGEENREHVSEAAGSGKGRIAGVEV
jgi:hypothetical protein